jgi:iron complex outermembrane receptor protein
MTPTKALLICLLCIPFFTEAQSILSGVVTDVKTNQPLIGAHVVLPSLNKLTLTNEQGRYTILNLDPATYTLEVSFSGYDPLIKEVKIETVK